MARGFALLSPEERREMGRKGGVAVQACATGHRFSSEEARAAGQKGARGRDLVFGTAPRRRQVLNLLADGPHRLKELLEIMGTSRSKLVSALATLRAQDQVVRLRHGLYALAPHAAKDGGAEHVAEPQIAVLP